MSKSVKSQEGNVNKKVSVFIQNNKKVLIIILSIILVILITLLILLELKKDNSSQLKNDKSNQEEVNNKKDDEEIIDEKESTNEEDTNEEVINQENIEEVIDQEENNNEQIPVVNNNTNTNNNTNNSGNKDNNNNNNNNVNNNPNDNYEEEINLISEQDFANRSINFEVKPHLTTVEVTWEEGEVPPYTENEFWVNYEINISGPSVNQTQVQHDYMKYYRFVDLQLNTTYTITIKAYQEKEDGTKLYTKETKKTFTTLSSPNYSSEDQAYVDNLFNLINSEKGGVFQRDTSLDLAAAICASSGFSDLQNTKSCLKRAGINNKVFASMDKKHNPFYGKISYTEFYNQNKDFYQKSAYSRIGVGYYQGVVHVISVSFCEDVDTSGLSSSTCK